MIDHLGLRVSDLAASSAFYARALAPLGYCVLMDHDFGVGLGTDGKPDLWLYPGAVPVDSVHVALAAPGPSHCRRLHRAALAAAAGDFAGLPGSARSTTRATTAPSSPTSTGITSKSSATRFGERRHANRGVPAVLPLHDSRSASTWQQTFDEFNGFGPQLFV